MAAVGGFNAVRRRMIPTLPRKLTNDRRLALVLPRVLGGVLGWALPPDQALPL